MKKMFIENLPRKGKNKGKIDWVNTIGYKVSFIYNDVKGEVEIIDYNIKTGKLIVKYEDKSLYDIPISSAHFANCCLGKILKKKTTDFKVEIGQVFKDEKRDLTITDREYRERSITSNKNNKTHIQNEKYYKYTCNKCGWTEGWIRENDLNRDRGCACCCNPPRITVPHINSIWAKAPWMIGLGVSEEDAKNNLPQSNKKIEVACPNCGEQKITTPNAIYNYKTISCNCSDKKPYPEKFMTNVLNQLDLKFETQYSPKWAEGKFYDFYLPEYNIIIETHGEQHYNERRGKFKGKTLKEEQENDRVKQETALKNGIEHYVVIDCRYSESEWIKNNILNSVLSKIFNMSEIDWLRCEEFALKNIVKEVCEYWNNKEYWETTVTIAQNNPWGIKGESTILNYLKKGAELGWCNYDAKNEVKRTASFGGKKNCKQVEVFKNGQSLGIFNSVSDLEIQSKEQFDTKLLSCYVSMVCNGKKPQYKGFTFRYINK